MSVRGADHGRAPADRGRRRQLRLARGRRRAAVPRRCRRGPYAAVSSLRDVTHRHKADLALRESEARYRLLADNSTDVITRTSLRGVITWISPSVRRLLGYSPQGLIGAPTAYLIHPEDLPAAIAAYRRLFTAGARRRADR